MKNIIDNKITNKVGGGGGKLELLTFTQVKSCPPRNIQERSDNQPTNSQVYIEKEGKTSLVKLFICLCLHSAFGNGKNKNQISQRRGSLYMCNVVNMDKLMCSHPVA